MKGVIMNHFSEKLIVLVQAVLLFAAVGCTNTTWKALFDGRTLDGWEVRGGFAKYHVEDGTIVGTTVKGSPNTFLCTEKLYDDFELEFEVKVDPELNSGVQIRSHTYKEDTTTWVTRNNKKTERLRKAGHVYGYQVEISSEKSGASGGVWDEARKAVWLYNASENTAESKAFRDNQWNRFRVVCIGDWIRTWVNGIPCADFHDPVDRVGFIGLQVHGFRGDKTAQVRWRNIRIKELGGH